MFLKNQKVRLPAMIHARLIEASTYAGLSALCLVVCSALNQVGVARYVALCGAILTAVGAIARSENNVQLAEAMDRATQLLPELTKVALSVEDVLSESPKH